MPFHSPLFKGTLAIIIACFFWGTTGTSASFLTNVSPLAIGAFAMGLGGVMLVATSFNRIKQDAQIFYHNKRLVVFGGAAVAVYPLAFYSSMDLAGVAIGTVISIASAPIFTVLLERVVNQKPITSQWVIQFSLGVIGVYLLVSGKSNETHSEDVFSAQVIGVVLGLVAGFSYALYAWVARNLIEKGAHSKSAMASVFGIAACLLLPPLLFAEHNLFTTSMNAGIALYMAIFPMFMGYLLFGYGLKHVHASQATLITLLEPALATVMAVLIVGERFTFIGWFGAIIIMLSLAVKPKKSASDEQTSLA